MFLKANSFVKLSIYLKLIDECDIIPSGLGGGEYTQLISKHNFKRTNYENS